MSMRYVVKCLSQLIRPFISMLLSATAAYAALAGEGNILHLSAFFAPVGPIAILGVTAVEHLLHLRDCVAGDVWVLSLVPLPTLISAEDASDRYLAGREPF
jgi:hypothetical protein